MTDRTTAYDTDYDWSQKLQDEGTWDRFVGKAKEAWAELTDQELEEARANVEQFIGTVKRTTGETAEAIERKIKSWID